MAFQTLVRTHSARVALVHDSFRLRLVFHRKQS